MPGDEKICRYVVRVKKKKKKNEIDKRCSKPGMREGMRRAPGNIGL